MSSRTKLVTSQKFNNLFGRYKISHIDTIPIKGPNECSRKFSLCKSRRLRLVLQDAGWHAVDADAGKQGAIRQWM